MGRLLTILGAILLMAGTANAADGDMKTGSFLGTWCGYKAVFNIDTKERGKWIFHGTLYFPDYHQTDELWIEQYSDNTLRMIRTLPGGRKQVASVNTLISQPAASGGFWQFSSNDTVGPDCEKKAVRLRIPD